MCIGYVIVIGKSHYNVRLKNRNMKGLSVCVCLCVCIEHLIIHYIWRNSSHYMLHGSMNNVAYCKTGNVKSLRGGTTPETN